MDSVFIVTSGQYSDYCIEGAYTTKEKASIAADTMSDGYVVEYILDDDKCNPRDMHLWEVEMFQDRSTHAVRRKDDDDDDELTNGKPWNKKRRSVLFVHFARDEQHAVKIANEKMSVIIATDTWPEKAGK